MQYASSTSLYELAAWLRDCRRIVTLTHTKPDGDAIGSTIAIVRALNATNTFGPNHRAEAWYTGSLPSWFKEVVGHTPHRVINQTEGEGGPPPGADPDAILVVDTGSWRQIDTLADWLRKRNDRAAIIDHHVHGDPDVAALRVIDRRYAAACQPAAELCMRLLGVDSLSALPKDIATPLYLGLATDTGWFRHSNVDREVMNHAGELISAGAANVWLYQTVEQQFSEGRLRLLARALSSLELVEIGRAATGPVYAAIMSLTTADFRATGAEPGESGGFVDFPQTLCTVRVTALLTDAGSESDPSHPLTKISLRSKEPTNAGEIDVDVNRITASLGGGGHVRAAGARLNSDLAATRTALVQAIRSHVAERPRP